MKSSQSYVVSTTSQLFDARDPAVQKKRHENSTRTHAHIMDANAVSLPKVQ